MENSQAIRIVQALANGINPITGEAFPDASPYNDPAVIRALFQCLRALDRLSQQDRVKRGFPENAGKPWATDQDHLLVAAFDRGTSVSQMAREHGRTEGAIAARLVRLGRLSDRSEILTARRDRT
jgi:hypothetical protein